MWENDWGETFDTEEEARENVQQHMEREDYELQLEYIISHSKLLAWAMEQDAFYERFEEEISKAEAEFFDENYHEVAEDE
jgi:hypothetical protein